jgi:hypothetical protein
MIRERDTDRPRCCYWVGEIRQGFKSDKNRIRVGVQTHGFVVHCDCAFADDNESSMGMNEERMNGGKSRVVGIIDLPRMARGKTERDKKKERVSGIEQ